MPLGRRFTAGYVIDLVDRENEPEIEKIKGQIRSIKFILDKEIALLISQRFVNGSFCTTIL